MSDIVTSPKRRGRPKAEPVVESVVEPVPEAPAAPLMLKQEELHRMRHYEAEARAARAEAEACRIRKKYILSILDKKGLVETEEKTREKHIGEAKDWAKKHEILIAHISMRLNVDLTKCAFDPETGLVVPPDSATGK